MTRFVDAYRGRDGQLTRASAEEISRALGSLKIWAHLQAWLDRAVYEDERAAVERGIMEMVADDRSLIDMHSWPEIRRMAEAREG